MSIALTPTARELEAADATISVALAEDLAGVGDLTSQLLIPSSWRGAVEISVRQPGVVSGLSFAESVFQKLNPEVSFTPLTGDGSSVTPGTVIARVEGPVRVLLTGERTALNLLTLLGGVATLTRRFVDLVGGTNAVILDTRKTLPGLRLLQKYAVRCGGGTNHRIGLYDGILIKDNHVAAWKQAGGTSLAKMLEEVRSRAPVDVPLEIEVDTLAQLEDALRGRPDIILCDNMTPQLLSEAVLRRDTLNPDVLLEASGGVNLSTVRDVAESGVDRISIGALTHSAPALDVGFDWPR